MRLAITVLAVMATVGHLNAYELPSFGRGKLAAELQQFVDLVPIDKVVTLTKVYLARDEEFQTVLNLIISDDIKSYINDVEAMPEFRKLMQLFRIHGLDSYLVLHQLKEFINVEIVKVMAEEDLQITGGLFGYLKDLTNILPMFQWMNLFEYKVLTSKEFRRVAIECMSPKYTDLFTSSFNNKHFQNVLKELKERNIDSDLFHANFITLFIVKAVIYHYL